MLRKNIENFPFYYFLEDGKIFNIHDKEISTKRDSQKRKIIYITSINERKNFNVDELIAEAFLEKPKKNEILIHIDGDNSNDHYKNLKWVLDTRKTIERFPSYYFHEDGKITIMNKEVNSIRNNINERKIYVLTTNEGRKNFKGDELIAEAFYGKPKNYEILIHIDGDNSNNHYKNLKWVLDTRKTLNHLSYYYFHENGKITNKKDKEVRIDRYINKRKIIYLSHDEEVTCFYLDELIAEAFYGKPKNNEILIHIDGDNSNDHFKNLKWVLDTRKTLDNFPYYYFHEDGKITNKLGITIDIHHFDKKGYIIVRLESIHGRNFFKMHELLAKAFLETPETNEHILIHINEDKKDNNIKNLKWIIINRLEGIIGGEKWKIIKNLYPNYKITENGKVYSEKNEKQIKEKILKSGYKNVSIIDKNNKSINIKTHILCALAFLDNPNNLNHVMHIDGDKNNNHYSNLKWIENNDFIDENNIKWRHFQKDNDYIVSETGQFKSLKNGIVRDLKQQKNLDGYLSVNLGNKYMSSRIVLSTFKPKELNENKPYVDHKNRIRDDNNINNLAAVSSSENNKNKIITKERKTKSIIKLNLNNDFIEEYSSCKDVIEKMNLKIKESTVRQWARKNETRLNFIWKYKCDEYIPKDDELSTVLEGKFGDLEINFSNCILYSSGVIINTLTNYKYSISRNGENYPTVFISNKGKRKIFKIHRLLALFFIPGRTDEKCVVNHINQDKGDYNLQNLEWVTQSENVCHSIKKNNNYI